MSVDSRPLSVYQSRFTQPERAIFTIPCLRQARILLDKNGEFQKLQQKAWAWTWEPLRGAADAYASQVMVEQTEMVLKLLKTLMLDDRVGLSAVLLELFAAVTNAVAVQRGVLMQTGNDYFHQVQEAVGQESVWTHIHARAAGITTPTLSLRRRGWETLSLYKETAQLLKPSIDIDHWGVIEQTICMIEHTFPDEEVN